MIKLTSLKNNIKFFSSKEVFNTNNFLGGNRNNTTEGRNNAGFTTTNVFTTGSTGSDFDGYQSTQNSGERNDGLY